MCFADLIVDPVVVINLSCEYDYMLDPMSPPHESSDPGRWGSGGLLTHLS